MKVLGLLSGTSADGIDAALCEITGAPPQLHAHIIGADTYPYPPNVRARVLAACEPANSSVDALCILNFELGELFAQAALRLLSILDESADLIASHGQTVWHEVRADGKVAGTLQLTEASVIAERTGITTVSNFRARDVAAGGQGAPLVGYLDWLLLRHPTRWRAIQNIGGIGNVTFLPPLSDASARMMVFDTGPGNALVDSAVQHLTQGQQTFDNNGDMAKQGRVHDWWLAKMLHHPYFHRQPPKTTGREMFGTQAALVCVAEGQAHGLSSNDIIATLTALTARSIADAYTDFAPAPIEEVILAGGGQHNQTLVNMIHEYLDNDMPIYRHGEIGISSDHKEALLFAILGYETWHNRAGSLPEQTGARHPVVLGQITPAENYVQLLRETWGQR